MSNDDISSALDNLAAIKSGDDPRSGGDESTTQTQQATSPQTTATPQSDDALVVARQEVDRLYEKYSHIKNYVPRSNIHIGVARWERRNGVCKYGKRLDKHRFGKRMTSLPSAPGEHAIVIDEQILEQGNRDEFIDTVRHELAHALAHGKHDKYPSRKKHHDYDPKLSGHGPAWKEVAREVGADPSSTHKKKEDNYKYYIGCPNCGMEAGRRRRCKVIKKPFNRKCQRCGESSLVSYDAGDEMPNENGTVAVESIPWDNRSEWLDYQ